MGLLVWLHVLEGKAKELRSSQQKSPHATWRNTAAATKVVTYAVRRRHKQAHCVRQGCRRLRDPRQRNDAQQQRWNHHLLLAVETEDSEADRPSGMSRKHRIHSRFYWFTEFCNSQCLSHFAAPFISVQAKTFITEGCKMIDRGRIPQNIKQEVESVWQKSRADATYAVCHPPNPNCPGVSQRSTEYTFIPKESLAEIMHNGF